MAYKKLTDDWKGHRTYDDFIIREQFGVYVDADDPTKQPYIVLQGIIFRTIYDSQAQLKNHVPFTINIQINGEGDVYTYKTGTTLKYTAKYRKDKTVLDLDYDTTWFVSLAKTEHIPIPKNGEEFTINVGITDKNGDDFSFVDNVAGPFPCKLSGPYPAFPDAEAEAEHEAYGGTLTALSTGVLFYYRLNNPMVRATTCELSPPGYNDESDVGTAILEYTFKDNEEQQYPSPTKVGGYISALDPVYKHEGSFDKIYFMPYYAGSYQDQDDCTTGTVEIGVKRHTWTTEFGSECWGSYSNKKADVNTITLGYVNASKIKVHISEGYETGEPYIDPFLDPMMTDAHRNVGYAYYNVDQQLERYTGVIQGYVYYNYYINFGQTTPYYSYVTDRYYGMPYGERFVRYRTTIQSESNTELITDNLGIQLITGNTNIRSFSDLWTVRHQYTLNTSFAAHTGETNIHIELDTNWGRTFSFDDSIVVLPYHLPEVTANTYRARLAEAGDPQTDIITFNGIGYVRDDYGEYGVVEWASDISPLNNINAKKLYITVRYTENGVVKTQSNYNYNIQNYIDTGYYVFRANTEFSYDVSVRVGDDIRYSGYLYLMLDTALAIFDFLNGGTGVSAGKVAEQAKTLEIRSDWALLMPDTVTVENYDLQGNNADLISWLNAKRSFIKSCYDKLDIYLAKIDMNYTTLYGITGLTALTDATVIGKDITFMYNHVETTVHNVTYMWIPKYVEPVEGGDKTNQDGTDELEAGSGDNGGSTVAGDSGDGESGDDSSGGSVVDPGHTVSDPKETEEPVDGPDVTMIGGAKVNEPITITRPYLNVCLRGEVYSGGIYPKLFLSLNEPTAVDNRGIIDVNYEISSPLSSEVRIVGVNSFYYVKGENKIDVSRYMGRQLWLSFTFNRIGEYDAGFYITNMLLQSTSSTFSD